MRKGHSGKILANEADNTIAKSYDMIKYKYLSHFHPLIHKAFRNLFILPTQENIYHIGSRIRRTLTQGRKLSLTGIPWSRFDRTINLSKIQAKALGKPFWRSCYRLH